MTSFRADWLFSGEREPIRDGLLCVKERRVEYAGPRKGKHVDFDFHNSLILPGLVNAHTHLDLGELKELGRKGKRNGETFTGWIKEVVSYRRSSTPQGRADAIRAGIEESLTSGTTILGDISVGGESLRALQQAQLRSVIYLELLGLSNDAVTPTLRKAEEWLSPSAGSSGAKANEAGVIRLGLSPHAPYSIHQRSLKGICELGEQRNAPLAMHLAESPEELQLIEQHDGPLREFLQNLGVWHPENLVRSLEETISSCCLSPYPLLVHCSYLQPEQIKKLPPHCSVVYCPRTHGRFSQSEHPYRTMLECGVNVALGTDSLASNPDLSVLHEARFLWQRDKDRLPPSTLLAMATSNGAKALGLGDNLGTLQPGKYADFLVLPCPDLARDPWDMLWESSAEPTNVFIAGERVTD
jgi:cytosine/adenosine deaminase-related metal-dependent hydrolase